MWVLKFKGETHYVNHVDADCRWSTKETPDNPKTKGAIKFKNVMVSIDNEGNALIQKE